MKRVLVLHNDNLPAFLRMSTRVYSLSGELEVRSNVIRVSDDSFDNVVSNTIKRIVGEYPIFDLIVLPFSFSKENYPNYSGLRVAAHIRYTPEWELLSTPILFVGPDTVDDVTKLSTLGGILSTYRVFLTNLKGESELTKLMLDVIQKAPVVGDMLSIENNYGELLKRVPIVPLANYATHHSIANEWAILRWIEMFSWKDGNRPEIDDKDVQNQLYFKYLLAKIVNEDGAREIFTKKHKRNHPKFPNIKDISGRIIYVDDEADKGWATLLGTIFKNSNAELEVYPYKKGMSKSEIIDDAKEWLSSHNGDCYLIDLRLHDDDFKKEEEVNKLSGIQLANYLLNDPEKGNKGRQVVIFTASNKTWNYEKAIAEVGACGYVVKESPEYNFTRDESYSNFCNFSAKMQFALKRSYLANYVNVLKKYKNKIPENQWDALDTVIELSILDEKKTVDANIINLVKFIEDDYIGSRFSYMNTQLNKYGKPDPAAVASIKFFKNVESDIPLTHKMKFPGAHLGAIKTRNGRLAFKYVNFTSLDSIDSNIEEKKCILGYDATKSNLGLALVSMYNYYNISQTDCNFYLKIKRERNSLAHESSQSDIKQEDLNYIIENIIFKMLKKDYPEKDVN